MTRSTHGRDEARQGLTLPRRSLRRLTEVGIYANPAESSKPSDPVDESESPFNEPGSEDTEEEQIPF
jgi:hypothetical protein